eukprot:TRINITY_DN23279_c0_g1_i4.p1 TRINITY_DN23279_c0_g1~~TRINITY_DN23279_c0_g1_i4.p1  ORF type:complete len:548 (-),score=60.91 TRINITY_DN23279_c0_g1_i4:220-1626(-)
MAAASAATVAVAGLSKTMRVTARAAVSAATVISSAVSATTTVITSSVYGRASSTASNDFRMNGGSCGPQGEVTPSNQLCSAGWCIAVLIDGSVGGVFAYAALLLVCLLGTVVFFHSPLWAPDVSSSVSLPPVSPALKKWPEVPAKPPSVRVTVRLVARSPSSLDGREAGSTLVKIASRQRQRRPLPVFLMHGLLGFANSWDDMGRWIKDVLPETRIIKLQLFEGQESFGSLHAQVQRMASFIRSTVASDMATFADGYDLVCHSQGALVCRCLCEHMDDHRVRSLLSLAGPQLGVFGMPAYWLKHRFGPDSDIQISDPTDLLYSDLLQRSFSIADMWHNPYDESAFLHENRFLPLFNGLTNDAVGNSRRKANFLRLRHAVFLGGIFGNSTGDGTVKPAVSMAFGFWRPRGQEAYKPMQEHAFYINDTFGLRTLDMSGRLTVELVPDVWHGDWIHNETIARRCKFMRIKS